MNTRLKSLIITLVASTKLFTDAQGAKLESIKSDLPLPKFYQDPHLGSNIEQYCILPFLQGHSTQAAGIAKDFKELMHELQSKNDQDLKFFFTPYQGPQKNPDSAQQDDDDDDDNDKHNKKLHNALETINSFLATYKNVSVNSSLGREYRAKRASDKEQMRAAYTPYTRLLNRIFILAADLGYYTTVKFLYKAQGIDVNLENECGGTVLMYAAKNGHTAIVQVLLSGGADVNLQNEYHGVTALMYAAGNGHTTTVQTLLTGGANVNQKDGDDSTALMDAAGNGHTATVQALLTGGADINLQNRYGSTALIYAARNGHTTTVQTLLSGGANVNLKGWNGGTALMYAAGNGHTATVQALLTGGADINLQNRYGSTALIYAARSGHTAIVQLLQNYIQNLSTETNLM